jgi:hypothetical protein
MIDAEAGVSAKGIPKILPEKKELPLGRRTSEATRSRAGQAAER